MRRVIQNLFLKRRNLICAMIILIFGYAIIVIDGETDEQCQICSTENICSNEDEDMNEDDKENNKQTEKVIKKDINVDDEENYISDDVKRCEW